MTNSDSSPDSRPESRPAISTRPTPALLDTYLDQTLTGPAGQPLPPDPGFVFGTATPTGTREWERLHARQEAHLHHLAGLGFPGAPAYALGALWAFVEPLTLGLGMDLPAAAAFAAEIGQDTFLERSAGTIRVLDLTGRVLGKAPEKTPDRTGVCVMPNTEPGEICFMRGGPYGSRAINASLDWRWERQRLIAALDCHTCDHGQTFRIKAIGAHGKIFTSGGAIALVPHEVETRFTITSSATHG